MKNLVRNERRAMTVLALLFVLLAAGIVGAGYMYSQNYAKEYRTQVERQLSAIADLKVGELVQWRKERLGDALIFYKNTSFSSLTRRIFENPQDVDAQEQVRMWLTEIQSSYGYDRVYLLDSNGIERVSIPDAPQPIASIVTQRASQALQSRQVTMVDFYWNEYDQRVYLMVLVPVLDEPENNRAIGILALRVDPEQYLYPLISRWPTPSETAETLIVRRDGNDALFLNELRFQKNTALNLRIPLEITDVAAVKAVLGQTGIVEGIDYRGVPVLADLRAVPDSPWFLVARMDNSEIYAPMRERQWEIILLAGALLFGAVASGGMIWRQQRAGFYREKYEAAKALQESEKRYRSLFENMLDGYAFCRMLFDHDQPQDFIYIEVNTRFEELTGLMNVVGKKVSEVIPGIKESNPELFEIYGRVASTGEPERFETFVESLGIWFSISVYSPAREYFVAVFDNITERKQAEEALIASEVRYRRLFEAARDGILILDDATGTIVDVNPFLVEMLGFPREQFLDKKLWELGFFKDIAANQANFAELQQKGYIRYENLPLETGNGRRIEVEFVSNTYQVNHHKVIQCNVRDITERARAERKLRAFTVELERSNRELEQFAYVASHDLQEPLRMVSSYVQLIAKRYAGKLDTDADEFIGFAVDGADRMHRMINDLLQYSRVNTRAKPFEPTDTEAVVNDALVNLQVAIEDTHAVITHDPLPTVLGDGSLLAQVFQNLIGNALKFRGDETPRVHISARRLPTLQAGEDRGWVFSVRDHGIGIDPQYFDRIFRIFQRLHTRAEYSGTGIGLAICKKIVERHGGSIWVESEPGKGSTFYFTIPATREK
jgi:PAS domain S-box-containing protein